MHEIQLPRLNSNDTEYVVIEWLREQGSLVRAGEPLVAVETSKTIEELAAEVDGVLHQGVTEGDTRGIGATIGWQFESSEALAAYLTEPRSQSSTAEADHGVAVGDLVLTEAARELVERHGVPVAALRALQRRVIRARDVELAMHQSVPSASFPRRLRQDAVAAVVQRSHREVPAAFTVMRIQLDQALELQRTTGEQQGVLVGLPEMFVRALGLLDGSHPQFFAAGGKEPGARRDVGVTIDVGTGLFIPVVAAAGTRSLADIAATLMGYRKKAFKQSFQQSDLGSSGDIALSLNNESDVVLAQTIIFPGHICMVSIGGTLTELVLDAGTVATRSYLHVGLTYDHRYVNGRDAVEFLTALKHLVENPARLAGVER